MFKCVQIMLPNTMSLGICFKKLHLIKVGAFAWHSIKIRVIFGVRFERRKVDKKTISIIIISSYTVSKLVHFFLETQCIIVQIINKEYTTHAIACSARNASSTF